MNDDNACAPYFSESPAVDQSPSSSQLLDVWAVAALLHCSQRHVRRLSDKGICARIALVFACTQAADGISVSAVSLDCVRRAIRVTDWFKHESFRIYTSMGESDENRNRRQLVEWIAGHGGSVTVRDLTHSLWAYRGKTEAAREALDELEQWGVDGSGTDASSESRSTSSAGRVRPGNHADRDWCQAIPTKPCHVEARRRVRFAR